MLHARRNISPGTCSAWNTPLGKGARAEPRGARGVAATHPRPHGGHTVEALDPEAAANWLMVYMTYFRNMAAAVASHLNRSIGLRAATMQFGNIVEEAIMNSFHIQRRAAEKHGIKLETIDDLFTLNNLCHHEAAARLAPLGIEVFDIRREGSRYIMETPRCGILEAAETNPPLRVLPPALVSGLIKGLGLNSRWLSAPKEKQYLCHSSPNRYDYIVYLDDQVQPPACRIIVEPPACSQNN